MRALWLLALATGCANAPLPPIVPGASDAWTETPLDDAFAAEREACHVRIETVEGATQRTREHWDASGWSFAIARVDETTTQARARVVRGEAALEAFASVPATSEIEHVTLLASLAHPERTPLPAWSTLARVYRAERDGEVTTLEEYGDPALTARHLIRERDGGETLQVRGTGAHWSAESRAWVDGEGRHLESRHRRGDDESVISSREERDASGRVVREHRSYAGYGRDHEETTTFAYDPEGRLASIDGNPIEHRREGDTVATCSGDYCVREDAEGRLLSFGSRGRSTTITRDERGRVTEVRYVLGETTRVTTIRRDATGHRIAIVSDSGDETTGTWEGDRLLRTSSRRFRRGELRGTETLKRTYDDRGRLTRSILVRRTPEAPEHRSEMRVSYSGCGDATEIVLEPDHTSSLEGPFELVRRY